MRNSAIVAAALLALATIAAAAEPAKLPTTPAEKMGYAIGVELASKFRREKFDFDVDMASQGLRDAMAGRVAMSSEELATVLNGFQAEFRRKIVFNRQQASMANRERNDRFFATNKSAEGVRLLPSGVQYRVLRDGSGPKPTDANTVSVSYRGTLLDGTEFDRADGAQPAHLKVANLVQGWRIAMSAMPVGSRWQVWVPAALAYGDRGAGSSIGPQEPLVFDIDLQAIDR